MWTAIYLGKNKLKKKHSKSEMYNIIFPSTLWGVHDIKKKIILKDSINSEFGFRRNIAVAKWITTPMG